MQFIVVVLADWQACLIIVLFFTYAILTYPHFVSLYCNNTGFILHGLASKPYWLKPKLIEGLSTVGIVKFWSNALLVRNGGIYPWMKTPHTLRRPLPGIKPTTYRSLWNSEQCQRFYPFSHRGRFSLFVILYSCWFCQFATLFVVFTSAMPFIVVIFRLFALSSVFIAVAGQRWWTSGSSEEGTGRLSAHSRGDVQGI